MMQLSLEIPTPHLHEFLPLTDFPFALAHLVLDDNLFNYRTLMKYCLLDNGMYERGNSLEIPELLEAAKLVDPVAVIAPDWMDDMTRTVNAVVRLIDARPKDATWKVSGVVQGRNLNDRLSCYKELQILECTPICFPFRAPRAETILTLRNSGWLKHGQAYHLLGLQTLDELKWKFLGNWSVDTGKPFKGFKLNTEPIRGHGKLSLHSTLTEKEHRIALWNICYMRRLMV